MELDKKIIGELKSNSRATNVQIAKKLGVSEGTIRKRVNNLVKNKTIRRFTVDVTTKTGFSAIVLLKSKTHIKTFEIVDKLKKIKDIKNIYETAGEYDIILEIVTESAEMFNNIIETVRYVEGIEDTETLAILKIS